MWCVCNRWKTSIGNCNDEYSTDVFPNASCLKKPYENKTTTHPAVNRNYTETVASHDSSALFPNGEHPSHTVRISSQMEETKCKSHGGLHGGWEASLMRCPIRPP